LPIYYITSLETLSHLNSLYRLNLNLSRMSLFSSQLCWCPGALPVNDIESIIPRGYMPIDSMSPSTRNRHHSSSESPLQPNLQGGHTIFPRFYLLLTGLGLLTPNNGWVSPISQTKIHGERHSISGNPRSDVNRDFSYIAKLDFPHNFVSQLPFKPQSIFAGIIAGNPHQNPYNIRVYYALTELGHECLGTSLG